MAKGDSMTRKVGVQISGRLRRRDIMLATPISLKHLSKWPYIMAQPKLDGIRCTAHFTPDNRVVLNTSSGITIETVPHINTALAVSLPRTYHTDLVLDGELVARDFSETISIIKRNNLHTDFSHVRYKVFDIINDQPQTDRIDQLLRIACMLRGPYVQNVSTSILHDYDEVVGLENRYVAAGYEGIILRNPTAVYQSKRTTDLMKHKPMKQDVYMIVGYNQELDIHGTPKQALGSFVCTGQGNKLFSVGSGLTQDQRATYWAYREKMIGKYVVVSYQQLTADSRPRFPTFVRIEGEV